jgi:hypothetical protein
MAAKAYEGLFIACDGYQADFLRIENVLTCSVCHPQGGRMGDAVSLSIPCNSQCGNYAAKPVGL